MKLKEMWSKVLKRNRRNYSSEICLWLYLKKGFSGGSVVKNLPASAGDIGSFSGSRRFPWRRAWQPTSVFLPGESHGQRSLVGYSLWMAESDTTEAT